MKEWCEEHPATTVVRFTSMSVSYTHLIDQVKKVKDGNFEIQIAESSQDEIGELAENINKMLRKIQTLIDEVYKSKLDKKSLELDLLQSKINPHFLYNNLSAIN